MRENNHLLLLTHGVSLKNLSLKHKQANIALIVDHIYTLESSNGRNDGYCQDLHAVNGYGYRQNKHEMICYDTHNRVRDLVINWVTEKINLGWSVGKLTCYYNQGRILTDCPYYQNYLKL